MAELVPLLNVEDVGRSIDFYETVLGARVENRWAMQGRTRWARIAFEGGKLMLNEPDATTSAERRARSEFADAMLYVMCDDAPARRARLESSGIAVSPLEPQDYGNDEFAVRDPDGYVVRFSSPRA
jgi:uncharacterized glyoxalase superfamily protein PhnB